MEGLSDATHLEAAHDALPKAVRIVRRPDDRAKLLVTRPAVLALHLDLEHFDRARQDGVGASGDAACERDLRDRELAKGVDESAGLTVGGEKERAEEKGREGPSSSQQQGDDDEKGAEEREETDLTAAMPSKGDSMPESSSNQRTY